MPGPKPLTKYRFYLDVKNHITSGKLETKIKDLGGVSVCCDNLFESVVFLFKFKRERY